MVDRRIVDEISKETAADKRSVTKVLAGLSVRGAAGAAIMRAVEARGLQPAHDGKQSPKSAE